MSGMGEIVDEAFLRTVVDATKRAIAASGFRLTEHWRGGLKSAVHAEILQGNDFADRVVKELKEAIMHDAGCKKTEFVVNLPHSDDQWRSDVIERLKDHLHGFDIDGYQWQVRVGWGRHIYKE
jgi:hypothetical protein